jgi:hypothetical protein
LEDFYPADNEDDDNDDDNIEEPAGFHIKLSK